MGVNTKLLDLWKMIYVPQVCRKPYRKNIHLNQSIDDVNPK